MPLAAIAAIEVAGSIGGAAIASHGATKAADAQVSAANYAASLQKQAADESLAFQKQQFATQQSQAMPWLQSGYSALANLDYLLGLSPQQGSVPGANSTLSAGQPTPGNGVLQAPIGNYKYRDMGMALENGVPQSDLAQGNVYRAAPNASSGGVPAPQDLSKLVNPNLGAFGSLNAPFSEKFQAPTGLTEQNDPGFQARLKLGQDALERSAAAKGGVLTGGTAKGLDQFAQDYASNEYGNVYNRSWNEYANRYNQYENNQTNQFNRLAAVSGVGQTTSNNLGMLGQQAATNIGNTLTNSAAQIGQQANNAGAARASGYAASANAYGSAISGSANNISQLLLLRQMGMV
jgi:hypothetical protein